MRIYAKNTQMIRWVISVPFLAVAGILQRKITRPPRDVHAVYGSDASSKTGFLVLVFVLSTFSSGLWHFHQLRVFLFRPATAEFMEEYATS